MKKSCSWKATVTELGTSDFARSLPCHTTVSKFLFAKGRTGALVGGRDSGFGYVHRHGIEPQRGRNEYRIIALCSPAAVPRQHLLAQTPCHAHPATSGDQGPARFRKTELARQDEVAQWGLYGTRIPGRYVCFPKTRRRGIRTSSRWVGQVRTMHGPSLQRPPLR